MSDDDDPIEFDNGDPVAPDDDPSVPPFEHCDATCEGDSDDCTLIATTTRDTSNGYLPLVQFCESCAKAHDTWLANYDPPDPDGEEIFSSLNLMLRDRAEEARKLK